MKERENGEIKGGTCLIIGGEEENREGKDIWSDKVQDKKAGKCRKYLVRGRIGG